MLTEERKSELCLECLECCKSLTFMFGSEKRDAVSKMTMEFYATRGCTVHNIEEMFFVEVPNKCPHLSAFGCAIYAERPMACRLYDGRKHPVIRQRCLWMKEE